MSEMVTIYEPGDRFATMSREGVVRIFEVGEDGLLIDDSDLRHTLLRPHREEVKP